MSVSPWASNKNGLPQGLGFNRLRLQYSVQAAVRAHHEGDQDCVPVLECAHPAHCSGILLCAGRCQLSGELLNEREKTLKGSPKEGEKCQKKHTGLGQHVV